MIRSPFLSDGASFSAGRAEVTCNRRSVAARREWLMKRMASTLDGLMGDWLILGYGHGAVKSAKAGRLLRCARGAALAAVTLRTQEIEVATMLGLQHVSSIKPAIPA